MQRVVALPHICHQSEMSDDTHRSKADKCVKCINNFNTLFFTVIN